MIFAVILVTNMHDMNTMRIRLTLILSFAIFSGLSGQNSKKAIKKANKYYQLGQYAAAIPHYNEALSEKSNQGVTYKLGNCYRLTNKTKEAETAYQTLFDSGKRVRDKAYLDYSEVLMSNGKYEAAKAYLEQYISLKPEDEAAKETLGNMDDIQKITAYYSNVELLPFNYNTEADEHGAVFLDNGIVFVSDRKRAANLFKEQNGTTGRDFLGLYFSARLDRLKYGEPKILPKKINGLNKNTGPASFTEDGKTMVFSRNDDVENRKGEFALQLYAAVRENGKWKNIEKISFCNPSINYMHPAISPDGTMLFFVSDKAKGEGGADLYLSRVLPDGSWGRPENIGPQINTFHHEGFPFFSTSGKLYFCSKGHVGYGGFDVFFSEMDDNGNWSKPTNVGQPINSSQDDISFCMNANDKYGLFSSSRDGGDDDIYMFRFKEDDVILSINLKDLEGLEGITDASVQAVPIDNSREIQELNMPSDKIEMSLENDKSYEIIISKDGYLPYSKTISPSDKNEYFLQLEAMLKKKI